MTKRYFEIQARGDVCVEPSPGWARRYQATLLCRVCKFTKPATRPLDIETDGSLPTRPYGYVDDLFIPFVSQEFLDVLGLHETTHSLLVGNLLTNTKTRKRLWTICSEGLLLIRGNAQSEHQVCDACGRLLYTRVRGGYLSEAAVAAQHDVYCSDEGTLIVSEYVKANLVKRFGTSLRAYFLSIEAGMMKDGLPPDFSVWLTAVQRKQYKERRAGPKSSGPLK